MLLNFKAVGVDTIFVRKIKDFEPQVKTWILELSKNCPYSNNNPKLWRISKVVALLKPIN